MKTRHETVNLYKIKSQHLRRPKSEIRRIKWSRCEVDLPLFCPGRNWFYSELFGFNWAETWIYRDLVCKIWQHQRWAGFLPLCVRLIVLMSKAIRLIANFDWISWNLLGFVESIFSIIESILRAGRAYKIKKPTYSACNWLPTSATIKWSLSFLVHNSLHIYKIKNQLLRSCKAWSAIKSGSYHLTPIKSNVKTARPLSVWRPT